MDNDLGKMGGCSTKMKGIDKWALISSQINILFCDSDKLLRRVREGFSLLEKNLWWDKTDDDNRILSDIFRNAVRYDNSLEAKRIYNTFITLVDISTKLSSEEKNIFRQAIDATSAMKYQGDRNWLPEWTTSRLDPLMDQIKKTLPHYFTS